MRVRARRHRRHHHHFCVAIPLGVVRGWPATTQHMRAFASWPIKGYRAGTYTHCPSATARASPAGAKSGDFLSCFLRWGSVVVWVGFRGSVSIQHTRPPDGTWFGSIRCAVSRRAAVTAPALLEEQLFRKPSGVCTGMPPTTLQCVACRPNLAGRHVEPDDEDWFNHEGRALRPTIRITSRLAGFAPKIARVPCPIHHAAAPVGRASPWRLSPRWARSSSSLVPSLQTDAGRKKSGRSGVAGSLASTCSA